MSVHKMQENLKIRISNIEEEETRLQGWLECLQKVGAITAEWKVELPEIELKPAAQNEPAQEEFTRVDPIEECLESTEEKTQSVVETQPAYLDRDRFEMNLQQLRQRAEESKENQQLQEKEFEQLREQLCASRLQSPIGGRLGTLMSFLMKV